MTIRVNLEIDRFVIQNEQTGEFIGFNGKPVSEYPDAEKFDTWGKASTANQNYGPEWCVRSTAEV